MNERCNKYTKTVSPICDYIGFEMTWFDLRE